MFVFGFDLVSTRVGSERQRRSIPQPRVAPQALPWENGQRKFPTPTGLHQASLAHRRNPYRVVEISRRDPRVGALRQPWAERWNAVGVQKRPALHDVTDLISWAESYLTSTVSPSTLSRISPFKATQPWRLCAARRWASWRNSSEPTSTIFFGVALVWSTSELSTHRLPRL